MGYFDEKGMGYKYSYLLYVGFSILGLITVLVMRLNNRFCIFDAWYLHFVILSYNKSFRLIGYFNFIEIL